MFAPFHPSLPFLVRLYRVSCASHFFLISMSFWLPAHNDFLDCPCLGAYFRLKRARQEQEECTRWGMSMTSELLSASSTNFLTAILVMLKSVTWYSGGEQPLQVHKGSGRKEDRDWGTNIAASCLVNV